MKDATTGVSPFGPNNLPPQAVPRRVSCPALAGAMGLTMILAAWSADLSATLILSQTFDAPTPTSFAGLGRSVAIDGNNVLIAEQTGQTYLFDAVTGTLLQTFDGGGNDVTIDGNNVLIGAPFHGQFVDGQFLEWMGQAYLFTQVPEPATLTLMLVALAGFAMVRRRA